MSCAPRSGPRPTTASPGNPPAQFDAGLHDGFAQLWTWARDDDGWVYVFSTGFQRDKGIILRRVREDRITDPGAYLGWGWRDGQWNWGNPPTPVLEHEPSAEKFGEMCLRKIQNKWVLENFDASTIGGYDIDLRILDTPTDNLYLAHKTTPLRGSAWNDEGGDKIAQLYGPSIVPGSTLDAGLHLLVSQWMEDSRRMALPRNAIQGPRRIEALPPTNCRLSDASTCSRGGGHGAMRRFRHAGAAGE